MSLQCYGDMLHAHCHASVWGLGFVMSWKCHGDVMTHCRCIVMLLSGDWAL